MVPRIRSVRDAGIHLEKEMSVPVGHTVARNSTLRLESRYNISLFDSYHFIIGDMLPLFRAHNSPGKSFPHPPVR